uniref:Uncharacterized protein n=1 Tax=Zooxanthella nutricula TaxID=1333877 RepID=A0A7S2LGE6_9DINO
MAFGLVCWRGVAVRWAPWGQQQDLFAGPTFDTAAPWGGKWRAQFWSGDTVFLQAHTGLYFSQIGRDISVMAPGKVASAGFRIHKKWGGVLSHLDEVWIEAPNGKVLEEANRMVLARFDREETGSLPWLAKQQNLILERERGSGVILEYDHVYFKTAAGNYLDVEALDLTARFPVRSEWQRMTIRNNMSETSTTTTTVTTTTTTTTTMTTTTITVSTTSTTSTTSSTTTRTSTTSSTTTSTTTITSSTTTSTTTTTITSTSTTVTTTSTIHGTLISGFRVRLQSHTGNFVNMQGRYALALTSEPEPLQQMTIKKRGDEGDYVYSGDTVYFIVPLGEYLQAVVLGVGSAAFAHPESQGFVIETASGKTGVEIKGGDPVYLRALAIGKYLEVASGTTMVTATASEKRGAAVFRLVSDDASA